MKRKLFIIITLFTLIISNSIYAVSWLDSLNDKIMSSIGADKLMNKANEMMGLINTLKDIGEGLESFDVEGLSKNMMIKAFDKYKELGCDFLPNNYQNMTWEEIKNWSEDNQEKLETWLNILDPEEVEKADKWATENIIPMTDPIMNKVNELEKPLNDLQGKVNEIEPLLNDFIDGYLNIYNLLQDKEKALEYLEQYPEWSKMQERLKDFAEVYAKGDSIEAYKILDEITGLFSNSEAGKGWLYFFEVSEQVNAGKYVSKILKTLVSFSGSNELDNISEAQIEEFINNYIRDFKERTGIKDKPNIENAEKIKNKLEEYTKNTEEFVKLPEKLDKFSKSPIGNLITEQLNGNGTEALKDIMSNYSGIDKETINKSGLFDEIDNIIKKVGEEGIKEKPDFMSIISEFIQKLFKSFIIIGGN